MKARFITAGDILLHNGEAAIVEYVQITGFTVEIKIHTSRAPLVLSTNADILVADRETLEALVERAK